VYDESGAPYSHTFSCESEVRKMDTVAAYAGLFSIAFLAATLLPVQSEAAFVSLLALERYPVLQLLLVASSGNILGSCLNYFIGRFFTDLKWMQRLVSAAQRDRAEQYYRRYGRWSLLASWLPIVGDPLTVVAGILRENFIYFAILVTIAKVGRYIAVLGIHQAWFTYLD